MDKKIADRLARIIERHQKAVAKTRDALDESISELEALRETTRRAWDCLQDARDALSELA